MFNEFALYTKVELIHFERTQLLIVKGILGTSEKGLLYS